MRKTYVVLAMLLAFYACSKDNSGKKEKYVIPENILKLAGDTSCVCDPFIAGYKWQGNTVYVKGFSGPACSWFPLFFHEDGSSFSLPEGVTYAQFGEEATLLGQVWPCRATGAL